MKTFRDDDTAGQGRRSMVVSDDNWGMDENNVYVDDYPSAGKRDRSWLAILIFAGVPLAVLGFVAAGFVFHLGMR